MLSCKCGHRHCLLSGSSRVCVCLLLLLVPAQVAIARVARAITSPLSLAEFQVLPTEAVLLRAKKRR